MAEIPHTYLELARRNMLTIPKAQTKLALPTTLLFPKHVYHHKEDRVQAHILVCFLALALWRTLEQWMQQKGLGSCARQLVKQIAGIKSVDVVLPVYRAGVTTELRLRVVTTPEPATAQLLAHLGLRLPKGTREFSNVVPKTTP